VPSATDLALLFQMNPATASKGVNVLVELGALYKKRGIGMFVASGARELLRSRRREEFRRQYIEPLLVEATVLEIGRVELHQLLDATHVAASQIHAPRHPGKFLPTNAIPTLPTRRRPDRRHRHPIPDPPVRSLRGARRGEPDRPGGVDLRTAGQE